MPKSKKNNKEKKRKPGKNGLSRRSVLKMGAAAGAVTVLTSRKSLATAFAPPFQTTTAPVPPEPAICTTFTGSPATRPFRQQLPIPPALQPTNLNPAPTQSANIAAGEAPRAEHQRWNEFLPQKQYAIHTKPAKVTFHPDLPRGARVATKRIGTLAEILVGPAHENDGTLNLFGALRTSMATTGYGSIREFQKAEGTVAPSIKTEGKALQREQRVGAS